MNNKLILKDQIICAMFATITAICAQISIPFFQVPFTMQVFAIVLSSVILGARRGFIAQGIYILLGAIGLPVFAGFRGGAQIIVGPTGGYISSFLIMSLIIGYFSNKYYKNYFFMGLGAIVGLISCYLIGSVQLSIVTNMSLSSALGVCVIPFIPFDLAKIILGIFIGVLVKERIKKAVNI